MMKHSLKIKRLVCLILTIITALSLFTACDNGEESEIELQLTPAQVMTTMFELTKKQDYDSVASYCRSFSAYSIELYFKDTYTEFEPEWTERYSATLGKLFDEYVTYGSMKEDVNSEKRTATVTFSATSLDLDKFNKETDSEINAQYKNDFEKQMDYIDSVIGNPDFKSDPYTVRVDFRYVNGEWIISDKNFLLLLTLGYYS